MESNRIPVDFWFDAMCPWSWIASRWLLEVEHIRPVDLRWHVMSWSILQQGVDLLPEHVEIVRQGWGPARVAIAVEQQHGNAELGALYSAYGKRYQHQGRTLNRAAIVDSLAEIGLPVDLAEAAEDKDYDDALLASHMDGMDRVGYEVGTPILAINGVAYFGPVMSPIPRGEAAGRLFDGLALVSGTKGFFELKRSRTRAPIIR
ncbi:mycothiol-dependent nitroreductase Rv2466c family protein [Herbidospora mongoliensis]|uniref:mycothiol-dependent nitroreductase Rv2466c family protein n=1 Tax=Herbidospora mongoliensis TaxID=688067 RepID=UPI0012F7E9A1|nr:DsbA family protein [Herbidospora mongoliensis]